MRGWIVAACVGWLVPAVCLAGEPATDFTLDQLSRVRRATAFRKQALPGEIAAAKAAVQRARTQKGVSIVAKREAIAEAQAAVARLEAEAGKFATDKVIALPNLLDEKEPRVGLLGKLVATRIRVLQVLDKSSALLDMDLLQPEEEAIGREPASTAERELSVRAEGFDTSTWVDGATIEIHGPVQLAKTTTYETALGGTRKVFVMEAVDMESLRKAVQGKADP